MAAEAEMPSAAETAVGSGTAAAPQIKQESFGKRDPLLRSRGLACGKACGHFLDR